MGKAALTVTANNTNRIYGAANPVFTASYSGFVNGDTTGVLSGAPSLTTTATAASPVGNYTITATNRDVERDELQLQLCNGNVDGGKAGLTVTANNTNQDL